MKRVLVVDDSPTLVSAAYDELEQRGYEVEVAYDGNKAIEYLSKNPNLIPDLIVMDIEMPKMRGDEAARKIRDNPSWRHIPIIALTATSAESIEDWASLFDSYLVKPFGFEEMLELVAEIIGGPG